MQPSGTTRPSAPVQQCDGRQTRGTGRTARRGLPSNSSPQRTGCGPVPLRILLAAHSRPRATSSKPASSDRPTDCVHQPYRHRDAIQDQSTPVQHLLFGTKRRRLRDHPFLLNERLLAAIDSRQNAVFLWPDASSCALQDEKSQDFVHMRSAPSHSGRACWVFARQRRGMTDVTEPAVATRRQRWIGEPIRRREDASYSQAKHGSRPISTFHISCISASSAQLGRMLRLSISTLTRHAVSPE